MDEKLKLSQWHDGSVLPVHIGIYERSSEFFNYWDGKYWCWGMDTMDADWSRFNYKEIHPNQNVPWRGIVK